MVFRGLMAVLRWAQLVAVVGILALAVRVAHILSTGPLEDISLELLYLRLEDLGASAALVLSAILLEVYEFAYPWFTRWAAVPNHAAWPEAVNGVQSILLLGAALLVFRRVREYTPSGQRRHAALTLDEIAQQRGPRPRPAPDLAPEDEEPEDEDAGDDEERTVEDLYGEA